MKQLVCMNEYGELEVWAHDYILWVIETATGLEYCTTKHPKNKGLVVLGEL